MNKPKTEEIVEALMCRVHQDDCTEDCIYYSNKDFDCDSNFTVLVAAINRLEMLEAEVSRLKEQQRWIPVTEKLPEERVPVLTLGPQGGVGIGMYYGSPLDSKGRTWFYARHGNSQPTHWMPLPEPPKE